MLLTALHMVASSLQVPVIVLLMALVVVMVLIVGMVIAELFTEHRYFKLSLPKFVDEIDSSDNPEDVVMNSGLLGRQRNALVELLRHPNATPAERESLAVNLVAREQRVFDNRVKVTDLIAKVSPMLGLMGTLIPLAPGIMAIGEGDTELLAENLLVAFDTTVLGLIVAVVAVSVSTLRKSWYAKYMAAFEAATECVLERSNADAMRLSVAQPTGMQPGGLQQGGVPPLPVQQVGPSFGGGQLGGVQPGTMQPLGMQATGVQQTGMMAGGMQPGAIQPTGMQPGGLQQGGVQPLPVQQGGPSFGDGQLDGAHPGAAERESEGSTC